MDQEETTDKAPSLHDGKVLGSAVSAGGSGKLPVIHQIHAGPLAVPVNCRGQGEITVTVGDIATMTIPCTAHQVTATYNELNLARPRHGVQVEVAAPSGVRWSVAVGRPEQRAQRESD
ncbi:hypothetical protein ACWEP8_28200 [Streptomyces hydrogenans]